jgi:transcriptional regulator with XRE-family HTH domain
MDSIYKKIKQLRETANYTQRYVAEELGVDNATYSRIENGKIDLTVSRLIRLTAILHTTPQDLFEKITPQGQLQGKIPELTIEIKLNTEEKKLELLKLLLGDLSHETLANMTQKQA